MGAVGVTQFDKQIGRNVYNILVERNMLQTDLSRLLDESPVRTNRHINGKTGFTAKDIYMIAKVLNVSVDVLLDNCDHYITEKET